MLGITVGRGFYMRFENGWTVSVQFGQDNYCSRRELGLTDWNHSLKEGMKTGRWESKTAEIAAYDKDDNWYEFDTDTVKGYCAADEVAEFIGKVQAFK